MKPVLRPLACLVLAAATGPFAIAAETPMPQGVLGPSASASVDVAKDLLEITFSTTFSAADAIARYRAEAADYANQSGYATYTIREVNVSSGDWGYAPQPMARMASPASVSSAPLAVEPGKATVTATVNGKVQMK